MSGSSISSRSVTAGGGGGGGGGGTCDVLFPFKPVGEIVTVSVLGWLSMKGKSVKWISKKTGMKKESLYYHTYVVEGDEGFCAVVEVVE